MSVDLSSITEIRDKIGVITKITDVSGRVLWSAAPAVAIVTMESDITGNYSCGYFYIDYSTADEPDGSISTVGTYELPIGTVINFSIKANKGYSSTIYLNDEYVDGGDDAYYSYLLNGNITVSVMPMPTGGIIYITEVPENCIVFSISGDYAGSYIAEEGMTWAEWFASSYNETGKTADDVSAITDSNGNTVNLTDVIVDGTVYEVGFAKPVTITVTGNGLEYYVYISHEEGGYTTYTSPATFTANVGDTICCYCTECWGGYPTTYIRVNDLTMVYTNDEDDISYNYTVMSDATINLYVNDEDEKRKRVGQINIYDANA